MIKQLRMVIIEITLTAAAARTFAPERSVKWRRIYIEQV